MKRPVMKGYMTVYLHDVVRIEATAVHEQQPNRGTFARAFTFTTANGTEYEVAAFGASADALRLNIEEEEGE